MADAVRGRDGILFLATSIHDIQGHLGGQVRPSAESVGAFARNLETRAEYCRKRGITYRHVIFPEKACALRDWCPFPVVTTYTDLYAGALTDEVVDLQEVLAGRPEMFLRTDTHLTFEGMVASTQEVLRSLGRETNFMLDVGSRAGRPMNYAGDLGSKVEPPEMSLHREPSWEGLSRFTNQVGANDGLCVALFNHELLRKGVDRRLLVFGDSFMERSLALFGLAYSEVLFCRSRYFHPEIVEMYQPHDLVTESAERYFSNVRLDEVAPRFLLMYGVRGVRHSEDQNFYIALNAQLSRGRQHETVVRRVLAGEMA